VEYVRYILISILVSMVKLFNYANIELDIAFLSLGAVVFLNVLTFKMVRVGDIWEEYMKIYE